jgi:DNA anti-recombination protein RmuC
VGEELGQHLQQQQQQHLQQQLRIDRRTIDPLRKELGCVLLAEAAEETTKRTNAPLGT